jgi:hypothetical protein
MFSAYSRTSLAVAGTSIFSEYCISSDHDPANIPANAAIQVWCGEKLSRLSELLRSPYQVKGHSMKLSEVKIRQLHRAYSLRSPLIALDLYGGIKVSRHANRHPRTKIVSILSNFLFPGNVDSLYSKPRDFVLDTFDCNVALFLFHPESRLPRGNCCRYSIMCF